MDHHKDQKNAPWLSVPQFGDWDQKGPIPDYSLDFSKIRQMRKQNKIDLPNKTSVGNEHELINPTAAAAPTNHHPQNYPQHQHSPTAKRNVFSYLNWCVKA